MTTTELIKELSDIESKFGDLDVYIGNIKEVSECWIPEFIDIYGDTYSNRVELV